MVNSLFWPITVKIHLALFLTHELVSELIANEPDNFNQWLSEDMQDLNEQKVK